MSGFKRLFRLPNPEVRRDVEDELQSHVEMKAAELVEAGLDPDAARTEAGRRFGNLGSIRRHCNSIQSGHARNTARREFVDGLWQDLRIGMRTLRKSPGFTAVAALSLALGIGATSTIFSVTNAILFRPPSFEDPERLVHVRETILRGGRSLVKMGTFLAWTEQNHVFEQM